MRWGELFAAGYRALLIHVVLCTLLLPLYNPLSVKPQTLICIESTHNTALRGKPMFSLSCEAC